MLLESLEWRVMSKLWCTEIEINYRDEIINFLITFFNILINKVAIVTAKVTFVFLNA